MRQARIQQRIPPYPDCIGGSLSPKCAVVFGGELEDLRAVAFKDVDKRDIGGIYPDCASAYRAWKAKARQSVDNAHIIVHLHRLLDPADERPGRAS